MGWLTTAAVEPEGFGHELAEAAEVSPACTAFQAHQGAPPVIESAAQAAYLSCAVLEGADWALEDVVGVGAAVPKFFEKLKLVAEFGSDPIPGKGQALRGVCDLDLATANGGRAAHAALPNAGERVAVLVEENEIDIMHSRQFDGVGGQVGCCGDKDALHLVRGNGQLLFAGGDDEALAVFSEAGTKCIDDKLHELPHGSWESNFNLGIVIRS